MCRFLIERNFEFLQPMHAKNCLSKTSFIYSVKCKLGLAQVNVGFKFSLHTNVTYEFKWDNKYNGYEGSCISKSPTASFDDHRLSEENYKSLLGTSKNPFNDQNLICPFHAQINELEIFIWNI